MAALEDRHPGLARRAPQVDGPAEGGIFRLVARLGMIQSPVGAAELGDFVLGDDGRALGRGHEVERIERVPDRHGALVPVVNARCQVERHVGGPIEPRLGRSGAILRVDLRALERRSQVVDVARDVYPRIAEATEVAVEFNDKYDASDHTLDLHQLDRDLGKLGEEIAVRIEMEDRIIQALTSR